MGHFKQIDVHEARAIMSANDITVVDVRDEDSYQKAHIDGAVWLSDKTIEHFLSTADKNKPLICYCYHGFSSQSAAGFFSQQGFKDVYSVIGGFEEWRKNY